MVVSIIQNVRLGLKYRGGWRGLLEHMYTVSTMVDSRWSVISPPFAPNEILKTKHFFCRLYT